MARWLLRGPQPVILIDWSDLKPDKSWCLLRAAVPVGGRTLTLLDTIVRGKEQGSAEAERHFLQQLRKLIPEGVTPILVTDAGFRTLGFARFLRWAGTGWGVCVEQRASNFRRPPTARNTGMTAAPCTPEPGPCHASSRQRWSTAARRWPAAWWCVPKRVRAAKSTRRTPQQASRSAVSLKAAAREREPWLIVAAPELSQASARQLVNLYARRMQIELAFRDLKSHRYGHALEDSLTRQGPRLQILLLISTLATFVSWLAGLVCEAADIAHWLWPSKSTRKRYSTPRVGREALVRGWPLGPPARWLDLLRSPPEKALHQMTLLP